MKFSKVLRRLASELPELDQMFLRYQALKKQLKLIPSQETVAKQQLQAAESGSSLVAQGSFQTEEEHFIDTLNQDLERFNRFFIEREEEAVIQLQVLSERLAAAHTPDVLAKLVDFHGQCVLLLHWSLLNYAAVAKILKKHDKRTGILLRAPYLASCLQQPFNSTAIMSRVVRSAEELLRGELSAPTLPATSTGAPGALLQEAQAGDGGAGEPAPSEGTGAGGSTSGLSTLGRRSLDSVNGWSEDGGSCHPAVSDSALFRRTRLALETWDTLGRTAATPSTVLMEPRASAQALAAIGAATATTAGAPLHRLVAVAGAAAAAPLVVAGRSVPVAGVLPLLPRGSAQSHSQAAPAAVASAAAQPDQATAPAIVPVPSSQPALQGEPFTAGPADHNTGHAAAPEPMPLPGEAPIVPMEASPPATSTPLVNHSQTQQQPAESGLREIQEGALDSASGASKHSVKRSFHQMSAEAGCIGREGRDDSNDAAEGEEGAQQRQRV